jgi:hypothetical protein
MVDTLQKKRKYKMNIWQVVTKVKSKRKCNGCGAKFTDSQLHRLFCKSCSPYRSKVTTIR